MLIINYLKINQWAVISKIRIGFPKYGLLGALEKLYV